MGHEGFDWPLKMGIFHLWNDQRVPFGNQTSSEFPIFHWTRASISSGPWHTGAKFPWHVYRKRVGRHGSAVLLSQKHIFFVCLFVCWSILKTWAMETMGLIWIGMCRRSPIDEKDWWTRSIWGGFFTRGHLDENRYASDFRFFWGPNMVCSEKESNGWFCEVLQTRGLFVNFL